MNDIVVRETPSQVARAFQESGLFPDLRSEAQAFVKIVAGQELGLGPLASVSGLNVIKGRVTFSANLLATMVKRHPAYDYRVAAHDETTCRIVFYQHGEEIGTSEFTIEDAKRAGLSGTNWTRYPKAMLFARALTQGVRWYCPDVTSGAPAYSPEEIGVEEVEDQRSDLERLADLVEQHDLSEADRDALRDFIRSGGDEAIRSSLGYLEAGNLDGLLRGLAYESEVVE